MTATSGSGAPASTPHPLLAWYLDASDGRFPPVDGQVTLAAGLARRPRREEPALTG
jgi:hypothetical protein